MNPLQHSEQQTLEEGREWTRRRLQEKVQAAVDQIGPVSPVSGLKLKRARRVRMKLHTVSDDSVHACVQRRGPQAAAQAPPPPKTHRDKATMIIMMDGWMARHRGPQWGLKPPEKRADRVHWHEIKSAVIFRLNQRVQTDTGRRFLIKKHAVAVPAETEPACRT